MPHSFPLQRIIVLFLCQAFFWSTVIVGVAFSGLIGLQLASHQAMATIPMATLTIGNIAGTLPLSMIMQRYGRRIGFMIGAMAMIVGGGVSLYAIFNTSFWWFCLGNALLGIAQASAFYYRLAAVDDITPTQRGKALAWVLSGGVIAALIAPSLGMATKDVWLPYEYAGAFGLVIVLGLMTLIMLTFLPSKIVSNTSQTLTRPLKAIVLQPRFILSILNAAMAHSLMVLIMVATPLAIQACGFAVRDSTSVIQWHILGMFLPAFFSGNLIDRFGTQTIATIGIILLMISAVIAISGVALANFYSALFLLGVGWNFLYVAGSTQVTTCHLPEERGKVQGVAELIIACVSAVAAFGSGALLSAWGWELINGVVLTLLVLLLIANQALKKQRVSREN